MSAGPLSTRVAQLCRAVAPGLSERPAARVRQVRRRLDEPLRVAVAGRLKAGKSTLVNALIGRRVAPTGAGECTRVVTQFRYGTADRVEVVRRDGTRTPLPMDDAGMVPGRLGTPQAEISYVDVALTSDRLRDMIVVDTPGLSSATAGISGGTRQYLFSEAPVDDDLDESSVAALAGAEAILYVFTQAVRTDDVAALEAFRSVSARLSSNPVNSLGLFSKVDKLAEGADPWPVAGPLAAGQAGVLRRVVSDVVPVVGLLAETTESGRLTDADAAALRSLTALPAGELAVLTASVDLFVNRDCAVPAAARRRLLERLDLYGVAVALSRLAAAPRMSTGELVRELHEASGFARLRETLDRAFRWRSDAIKAGTALTTLERVAGNASADDRELLRDAIEDLVARPEYHRLRLLHAAQLVSTGEVPLPESMERELTRLALSNDPGFILDLPAGGPGDRGSDRVDAAELGAAARDAAGRWRAFAVSDATPAQSRVALVAHRGFHLLSQSLLTPAAASDPGGAP